MKSITFGHIDQFLMQKIIKTAKERKLTIKQAVIFLLNTVISPKTKGKTNRLAG